MNRNISLEAIDFAIRKSQIEFILNGKTEDSIGRYMKLKSAHRTLRSNGEYDKEGCLIALVLFKEHLESQTNTENEFKYLLLDKIKDIQYQIDTLN